MAYPTEKAVLDGIVTTLTNGCTGLHPLPYPTPKMATPAAFPVMRWPLQQTYGKRAGPIDAEIHVLVMWDGRAGQTLGEYTDPEGSKSIAAAIQAMPTFGVTGVTGSRLVEVSEPKLFVFPQGESYWGRTIRLQIFI
ncbi:MAG: hypothetical protein RL139_1510 [Gemmatimonadota bacterium]|jgi:hypothetical protein